MSEVVGSQGRSVVGECHGAKSLTARNSAERLVASAIRNREDLRFLDIVHTAKPFNIIYSTTVLQYGMLILKRGPCTAVIKVIPHMTLFFLPQYVLQYLRTSGLEKKLSWVFHARSLLSKQVFVFQGGRSPRTRAFAAGVCSGGFPRTRAASYSRRVFDWR